MKVETIISHLSKSRCKGTFEDPHKKSLNKNDTKNISANIIMNNGEIISSQINRQTGEMIDNKYFMALLITMLCPLDISRSFIKTLRHTLIMKTLRSLTEPLLFLIIHRIMIFWLKTCQPLAYIKSGRLYNINLSSDLYSCQIRHELVFRLITITTLFKQSFETTPSLAIVVMPFQLRHIRSIMKVGSYFRAIKQK